MATIHLQGIGRVMAEPASALEVGDRIMWNYGYVNTVVSIKDASPKFIAIVERDKNGKEWPRRLKKDRLVARMAKEPAAQAADEAHDCEYCEDGHTRRLGVVTRDSDGRWLHEPCRRTVTRTTQGRPRPLAKPQSARLQAAHDLAAEFGTDVSEWTV